MEEPTARRVFSLCLAGPLGLLSLPAPGDAPLLPQLQCFRSIQLHVPRGLGLGEAGAAARGSLRLERGR